MYGNSRRTTSANSELWYEGRTNSILNRLVKHSVEWESICERVTLKPGTVVVHGGTRPTMLHFPINCVIVDLVSTLGAELRHNEIQIAMHGSEDLAGFQALLSDGISSRRSVVDHGGQAVRCHVDAARRLLRDGGYEAGAGVVFDYAALVQDEVAQLAAAEVQLKVNLRVAAYLWRLTQLLGETVIPITHIRIGERLGIRRPSVTESLQALEAEGMVRQVDKGRVDVIGGEALAKRVQEVWPMLHQARHAFTARLDRELVR